MSDTRHNDNKASVDYGPFPWWSREILQYELRRGKTRAELAREWDTTWATINRAVETYGLEEEAA